MHRTSRPRARKESASGDVHPRRGTLAIVGSSRWAGRAFGTPPQRLPERLDDEESRRNAARDTAGPPRTGSGANPHGSAEQDRQQHARAEREHPQSRCRSTFRSTPSRLARSDARIEEQPGGMAPLEREERPGGHRAEEELPDERREELAGCARRPVEGPAEDDRLERERIDVPPDESEEEPPHHRRAEAGRLAVEEEAVAHPEQGGERQARGEAEGGRAAARRPE